jgi:hypothetical protein
VQRAFGEAGLVLALLGMLFAVGGAAVECATSGAYTLAQFAGWEWGKYRRPREAPRFTLAWLAFFALAFVIVETGVDPERVRSRVVGACLGRPASELSGPMSSPAFSREPRYSRTGAPEVVCSRTGITGIIAGGAFTAGCEFSQSHPTYVSGLLTRETLPRDGDGGPRCCSPSSVRDSSLRSEVRFRRSLVGVAGLGLC